MSLTNQERADLDEVKTNVTALTSAMLGVNGQGGFMRETRASFKAMNTKIDSVCDMAQRNRAWIAWGRGIGAAVSLGLAAALAIVGIKLGRA